MKSTYGITASISLTIDLEVSAENKEKAEKLAKIALDKLSRYLQHREDMSIEMGDIDILGVQRLK